MDESKTELTKSDVAHMAQVRASEIFKAENLTAITFFLHSIIPYQESRIKESEFLTIVANAKIEGMKELVELIIKNVK